VAKRCLPAGRAQFVHAFFLGQAVHRAAGHEVEALILGALQKRGTFAPCGVGFTARPGISLTVEYGSDHVACRALIEPHRSLVRQEEQAPLMSSEGVSEVLEEVAPIATRGKEIGQSTLQSGCNVTRMTDYENVFVMRSTHTCDPSSHD
jgi:hypothetical protein